MIGTMKMRRRGLLATASTAALLAAICASDSASAADSDRVPLWFEFGWHFEGVSGLGDKFAPDFIPQFTAAGFPDFLGPQNKLGYSYGGDGKISFEPDNSDWVFSAAVRFGRSHGHFSRHEQTAPASHTQKFLITKTGASLFHFSSLQHPYAARFEDESGSNQETHAIIDFLAGKDVGLGMWGHSSSSFSAGVRFAHFHSHSSAHITGDPDFAFVTHAYSRTCCSGIGIHRTFFKQYFHRYSADEQADRSFNGIGPSISWNSEVALAGNPEGGELGLDWAANAALLFGKQTVKASHRMEMNYYSAGFGLNHLASQSTNLSPNRTRQVTVPNAGGSLALTYRYVDAKLTLGYRADFFFDAIDGGIDTRKSETRGFFGPYASISIGVGD